MSAPTREEAQAALRALLWELPMEFAYEHPDDREPTRHSFVVLKERNVLAVHHALWTLRHYLDVNPNPTGDWK